MKCFTVQAYHILERLKLVASIVSATVHGVAWAAECSALSIYNGYRAERWRQASARMAAAAFMFSFRMTWSLWRDVAVSLLICSPFVTGTLALFFGSKSPKFRQQLELKTFHA